MPFTNRKLNSVHLYG